MDPVQRERILALRAMLDGAGPRAQGWDKAWQEGITPWDSGDAQPALIELLDNGSVELPKQGHALVPGCGRGYDAKLFAALGLETWGIDISPVAVTAAKEWLASLPTDSPGEKVHFEALDFFNFEPPVGGFDVAYDYTFFCALPADLHKSWAETYAKLIKPSGLLVALIYPIDGDRPGGPPYSVDPELVTGLLSPTFDRIHYAQPKKSSESHKQREMMSVWKRKA